MKKALKRFYSRHKKASGIMGVHYIIEMKLAKQYKHKKRKRMKAESTTTGY